MPASASISRSPKEIQFRKISEVISDTHQAVPTIEWRDALEKSLAITGARLIDGTGRESLDDACVMIEGDEIKAVGAKAEVQVRDGARVIDAEGKCVMPGLVDPEVHLSSGPPPTDHAPLETQALKAARNAARILRAGVTTIGNAGFGENTDLRIRDAIAEGLIAGPRILASGNPVQCTAGHGFMRSPGVAGLRADGVEGVRKAVRAQFEAGVDWIKINASGGIECMGQDPIRNFPSWLNFSLEELRAIADEAHAFGMKVNAHVQCREGIKRCLEAGIDSFEHGSFLDDEDLERMVRQGTFLLPTFAHCRMILENFEASGVAERALDIVKRHNEAHARSFEAARKAGVHFAMCSDAGSSPAHGANAIELEELTRQGLSPLEAVHAATGRAAEALGLQDHIGTLEEGKRADLVLIDGSPLEDIRILQDADRILMVIKDGEIVCEQGHVAASKCPPLQSWPAGD